MPAEFMFDGCTGFPEGGWAVCCLIHDYLYWYQPVSRLEADDTMLDCMIKTGYNLAAAPAGIGITLFGWIFWKRGRRGKPGTEPPLLRRWLDARLRGKKLDWNKERDDSGQLS